MKDQVNAQKVADSFDDQRIDVPTIRLWRQIEDINQIHQKEQKGMNKQEAKQTFQDMRTNLNRARELAFQSGDFKDHVVGNQPSENDGEFALELSGYMHMVYKRHQQRVQDVIQGTGEALKNAAETIEDVEESLQDAQDLLGGDGDDGLL